MNFKVGGPVDYKTSFYIERKIERRILRAVDRKDFVTIIAPRQVGKTSLLQKIQAIKSQQGQATALMDMSTMNPKNTSFERWSNSFTRLLQHCLSDFIPNDLQLSPPKDSGQFIEFWEQLSSKIAANNILILMDEASSVPSSIRDAFYSTIRWIFTDRTAFNASPNLAKLNFVFAGVFEPERLIENGENSPFNISQIFRLPDFTKRETSQLFGLIEEKMDIQLPDSVVDTVFSKVSGHPYYTQAIADAFYEELLDYRNQRFSRESISNIITDGTDRASDNVENIVKRTIKFREELISRKNDKVFIIDLLLQGKKIAFTRSLPQIARLELDGAITKDQDGNCAFRNEIVEDTFKKAIMLLSIESQQQETDNKTIESKPIGEKLLDARNRIKKLISNNRVTTALSELEGVLLTLLQELFIEVDDFRNEIVRLKFRYKFISDQRDKGVISQEKASEEINRIIDSIIKLLDSIK